MQIIIAVNYFRKTVHRRCLTGLWICLNFWKYQRSEYTGVLNMVLVLNMTGLWMYHGSMPELHRVPNMPEYNWLCSYHVTYAFQNESTLSICLNVKELLAGNRREIWSLSDCNWTRTHNHLLRKRTLIGWVFVYELSGGGFESRCMPQYTWIIPGYAWLCLNVPKYV